MFVCEGGVEEEAGPEEGMARGWFGPGAWGYAVRGEGGEVP